MVSGTTMASSSRRSLAQNPGSLAQTQQQARRPRHPDWVNEQIDTSELQLSSSIPQKRPGSSTSLIGMEPGSKRPSIVGPLLSACDLV